MRSSITFVFLISTCLFIHVDHFADVFDQKAAFANRTGRSNSVAFHLGFEKSSLVTGVGTTIGATLSTCTHRSTFDQ
jgi:hypothetical protein